ncbi:hypothetical protein ACB092_01G171100 [Castanea dentata]
MHLLMSYGATFHSLRFLFVENLKSFDAMLEDLSYNVKEEVETDYVLKVLNFLWKQGRLGYTHIWLVLPTPKSELLRP